MLRGAELVRRMSITIKVTNHSLSAHDSSSDVKKTQCIDVIFSLTEVPSTGRLSTSFWWQSSPTASHWRFTRRIQWTTRVVPTSFWLVSCHYYYFWVIVFFFYCCLFCREFDVDTRPVGVHLNIRRWEFHSVCVTTQHSVMFFLYLTCPVEFDLNSAVNGFPQLQ